MAIAPTAPKGIEALLPRTPANDRPSDAEGGIVLQISPPRTGQLAYKINQTKTGRDEIRGRLQAIFSTRAAKVMFIRVTSIWGDKDLDFSPIARSIDVARCAGVDHVGLLTPRVIAAGTRQIGNLFHDRQPATAPGRGLFLTRTCGA